MQFEHLVAVNQPGNPGLRALTRDELWRGLLRRALSALDFVESLETDVEHEAGEGYSERSWGYGNFEVRVRIEHAAPDTIVVRTHPLPDDEGGRLTITVEESEAGHLFVRFAYLTPLPEGVVDGVDVAAYLRSAYRDTDVAIIRRIREMVEAGEL